MVSGELFCMLAAIHLNNQLRLNANEVDYVFPYWVLPTKSESTKLSQSQMLP
jgi:hypothetical protein